MQKYFFVLGKNPTLSIVEIISILNRQDTPFKIENFSREIALLESVSNLDTSDLIQKLGGTVKIGKIIDKVSFEESSMKFSKIFSADNLIANYLTKTSGKLHTGISLYNCGGNNKYVEALFRNLINLNREIKNNLQEKKLKVGFVRIKERTLSSVSVFKNELINHGAEIVLITTPDKLLVGKTAAVQEFASFSFRDYGRPQRDRRSGIMPPKLARMMINLAGIPKDATLLDPFCGGGTIIQEGVILGYKNIIGSDYNLKAIENSKANIDWLFKNFRHLKRTDYQFKLYQSDVRNLSKSISAGSIDAIVTEPYLGPPLYSKPNSQTISNIFSEIKDLYLSACNQFSRVLKHSGSIVIIFPAFEDNGKIRFLEILDKIKKLGFRVDEIIPQTLVKNYLWEYTLRNSILFGDNYHFVKREIIKFVKN